VFDGSSVHVTGLDLPPRKASSPVVGAAAGSIQDEKRVLQPDQRAFRLLAVVNATRTSAASAMGRASSIRLRGLLSPGCWLDACSESKLMRRVGFTLSALQPSAHRPFPMALMLTVSDRQSRRLKLGP